MSPEPQPAAKSGRRWGLIVFWAVIVTVVGAGCGYLQYLGPPPAAASHESLARPADYVAAAPARQIAPADGGAASLPAAGVPVRAPIENPSPQLLSASTIDAQWQLPKISPDGVTPMQAYAASQLPPPDAALLPPDVPRVAVIVAGLGDDPGLNQMAADLPPEISLALSPYAKNVTQAAAAARTAGHETLLLLPMPGLLAGAPEAQNQATLDWAMAQFQGYAGVTDAFGPAMGGGFMTNQAAKTWLMTRIAKDGLFYVEGDPNAMAAPYAAGLKADSFIDASDGTANETVALAALVTTAEAHHAALAVLLNPTPDALLTLNTWTNTLVNQDILLVPVSALVQQPDVPLPMEASLKQ